MTHSYSTESAVCADLLPNTTALARSEDAGWTSLLARHSRSTGVADSYFTSSSPDQGLMIVTRGAMEMESYEGGRWRRASYHAGCAGLTAPGEIDRLRWQLREGHSSYEKLLLFLPATLMAETAEHFRRPGRPTPTAAFSSLVFDALSLRSMTSSIIEAVRTGAPDIYAEAAASWIAVQLFAMERGDADMDPCGIDASRDTRLARSIDYMRANLAEQLSLDAIASEAGISKFHFARLFKRRTGKSPLAYLGALRLNHARGILQNEDLPISTVAERCGFSSHSYFNRAFQQRYSLTPTAFRNHDRGRQVEGAMHARDPLEPPELGPAPDDRVRDD